MKKEEINNKKSALALAGFIIGIIGVCLSFIPILNNASFFFGTLSIIFGIIVLIKKKSKVMAITSLVLGILSVVITLSLQASWSNTLDDVSKDLDKATGSNTQEILKKDVEVNFNDLKIKKDEYGLYKTKLIVTVTNKLKENKSYSIDIEAVDSDGKRISTDTAYVNDLGYNQSQDIDIFTYIEDSKIESMKNANFKIIKVSEY